MFNLSFWEAEAENMSGYRITEEERVYLASYDLSRFDRPSAAAGDFLCNQVFGQAQAISLYVGREYK